MKDRIYLRAAVSIGSILIVAFCSQNCFAQRTLAWKYPKGAVWNVTIEQDSNIKLNNPTGNAVLHASATTQKTEMTWRVLDVAADGSAAMEQSIDRIVLQLKTTRDTIIIDTKEKKAFTGQADMLARTIQPLSDASFTVRTKPNGEILDLRLSDSTKRSGGPTESELMSIATQSACRFPEKPIQVGETWQSQYEIDMREFGKFLVHTTYQFLGDEFVEGKNLSKLKSTTAMKLANPESTDQIKLSRLESSGVLWFDHQIGRMDHSESQQEFVFDVLQGGQALKQEVKQKYRLSFSGR